MNRKLERMLTGRATVGVKQNRDGGRRVLTGVFATTVVLGGLVGSYPVSSAAVTWIGGDGSWTDDGNWDGPIADADLVIDNGSVVSAVDLLLNAGVVGGIPDSLSMSGSSKLNVGTSGTIDGGGSLLLTGAGTAVSLVRDIFVGNWSGVSSLELQSGATLSTGNYSPNVIGYHKDAEGRVTITGAGSLWTMDTELSVGIEGTGKLLIENGGGVKSGFSNTSLGEKSGSSGTVTVTGAGSTWDEVNFLVVGEGGSGVLNIENGGQVTSNYGYIGRESGGTGTVTVRDAGSLLDIKNDLIVGYSGDGTLIIENGAVVNSEGAILGFNPNGSGSVIVKGAGSRWNISTGGSVDGLKVINGTGSLTLSDGGVVAMNDRSIFMPGSGGGQRPY